MRENNNATVFTTRNIKVKIPTNFGINKGHKMRQNISVTSHNAYKKMDMIWLVHVGLSFSNPRFCSCMIITTTDIKSRIKFRH